MTRSYMPGDTARCKLCRKQIRLQPVRIVTHPKRPRDKTTIHGWVNVKHPEVERCADPRSLGGAHEPDRVTK